MNIMTPTIQTSLFVAIIGIVGIFIFMFLFYLMIKGLDKLLPFEEEKPIQDFKEDAIED